jgi:hypothetical protein
MPVNLNNNELNTLGTQFINQKGIITSGSVIYLDAGMANSYPGSGTTWTDLSETGYNSNLVNSPTYTTANGGAIIVDGSNKYINVGTFNYSIFTLCLWVYPAATQNQYADIFDNNHTGNQNFNCQQNVSNTNQYDFAMIGASNSSSTGFFNLTANTWSFLSFSWDNDKVRGYINGVLIGTGASATPNYVSPYLRLGAWAGFGNISRFWNGRYGAFYAYNRVLTASEILQNFNAQKQRYGI